MKSPLAPLRSLHDLRHLTPARVALGRTGASVPTQALLDFTLDHARARDAVHASFDASGLVARLDAMGLETLSVTSQVSNRHEFLRRPDLGRKLAASSCDLLARRGSVGSDVVVVVGDGLSPHAVNAYAPELIGSLTTQLASHTLKIGSFVVATGARVALGDEIGQLLNAQLVLMLIGERPGLSVPHSVGAYLTYGPATGLTDANRNCISNIHSQGLTCDEAAFKLAWLIRQALSRHISGVALKDESGSAPPLHLPGG